VTLYFKNPGEADVDAMTIIGVNIKEDKASAIGFFGSGFKYGVATVLRLGGKITMYVGLECYTFGVVVETIRGEQVPIVAIMHNGDVRKLGFTADMGKKWEPWMAYREFRCNQQDEKGGIPTTQPMEPEAGTTLITVECPQIEEAHLDQIEYFLSSPPRYEAEEVNIHAQVGEGKTIFYRGVRVGQYKVPGLFTYNFTSAVRLTEDRTILVPSEVERSLIRGWAHCTDGEMITKMLNAPEGTMEYSLNFGDCHSASQVFLDIAEAIVKAPGRNANKTLRSLLVRTRNYAPWEWVDPSVVQAKQLMRAEQFCLDMGYDTVDVTIRIVKNLGFQILGTVHRGQIYLSDQVFGMGTKMVAGTLLEEMIHIKHGFDDQSREMQNFLVDKIVTAYEEKTGNPL
jgi:hypothetical protein